MNKTLQTFLLGASIAMGVGAIATSPAQAGSLSGATIGGTAANDYLIYDSNATNTYIVPNTTANLQKVLDGNATSPTGNVELRASSETSGFDFTKNTTLSGTIGGETLTLSSLVASDWTSAYGTTTFGRYWFNQALIANGLSSIVGTNIGTNLFNSFVVNGGFQRFSDPNISYVNQDDTSGLISIGLAGHLNATNLLLSVLPDSLKPLLLGKDIKASEVVKYTYNGETDYLFSFTATNSNLTELSDAKSHSGSYEVSFQGLIPIKSSRQSVPEPSILLGLLGVAGIFATQSKLKKVSG
ncbi:NF038130 family PEP-CTERM protein [Anabaena sp. CCY 9402-a]|uniref:NF038130 family PEP-CTERM protein n=1 Tax=Anabaena sp. CCY 9402-a TaxID=3103867 RepID=UPI0039C60FE5